MNHFEGSDNPVYQSTMEMDRLKLDTEGLMRGGSRRSSVHSMAAFSQLQTAVSTKDFRFTVENEKVEVNQKSVRKRAPFLLSILKCFVAIFMSGTLLVTVAASKLSLVSIGHRLRYERNTTGKYPFKCGKTGKASDCEREVAFIMLTLIMVIPHVIALFRAIWNSAWRKSHPWPTGKAIGWGVFGSMIEALGMTLFALGVLSIVRETDVVIVLMNALFVVPVIWQIGKACTERFKETPTSDQAVRKHNQKQLRNMVLSMFAMLFQVGGLVGIVYATAEGTPLVGLKFTIVPLSILLTSLGWTPKMRKLQIDHDLGFITKSENTPDRQMSMDAGGAFCTDSEMEPGGSMPKGMQPGMKKKKQPGNCKNDSEKVILETKTSRGKATIINSFTKILFIPFSAAAVAYVMKLADITQFHKGFYHFAHNDQLIAMFFVQVCASIVGYLVAWFGCTMTMQRFCFAFPLTLSTPLTVALVVTKLCDKLHVGPCTFNETTWLYTALFSVSLWLGQFFATTYYAWKSQDFIMAGEPFLFWVPTYDGIMLEQNLLLNRKNEATNEYFVNYRKLVKDSSIYICTTMYHEADYEMEQLLFSIAGVDKARQHAGRKFETHIFLDDGVRDKVLKRYALQLISLLEKTLEVLPEDAVKYETPYGLQLRWQCPGKMYLYIHLKDNFKVKNKKRWSQVMYMSYVLDFRESENLDHAYVLTTDADVRFTPDDVMALMDFMSRDPNVGAVCARTHPLGNGPMVWYQIFDYAIGHWLLKVAEDVLGSVLCSPGCFSIYRARALKDVLPTYASHVECAMDFLTKDMGEDRWMCTLMIENGWRLEYCAAAENSTYCPDTFDEFFKQRRRWTPSTLANQIVMIQQSGEIRKKNDIMTIGFLIYQVLLLVSTIIGPSNVILIIASGLSYAYPDSVNLIAVFVFVVFTVGFYIVVCLYTKSDTQLMIGKLLTFLFSIIMTLTMVGLMAQVADDMAKQFGNHTKTVITSSANTTVATTVTSVQLHLSPSTIYLLFLMFMFMITSMLHGKECLQVIHGLWFLLCLPSGYLFLTIYSVANLQDRSWGTREEKKSSGGSNEPWYRIVWDKIVGLCGLCCRKKDDPSPNNRNLVIAENMSDATTELESDLPVDEISMDSGQGAGDANAETKLIQGPYNNKEKAKSPGHHHAVNRRFGLLGPRNLASARGNGFRFKTFHNMNGQDRLLSLNEERYMRIPDFDYYGEQDQMMHRVGKLAVNIEDWLRDTSYSDYIDKFKDNGYDDTSFLFGLKEEELLNIGIDNRGHRKRLLAEIERLPPEEIDQEVPEDVSEWLIKLGLQEYWNKFSENAYSEPNSLADLKFMDKNTLRNTFSMNKEGHVRKLMKAIKLLQYPNAAQKKIRKARIGITNVETKLLETESTMEQKFWAQLRNVCLLPEQGAFSQSEELKDKLGDLRNAALMILIVANVLWLTIMLGLISQGSKLQLFNTNFLGLAFLTLYTSVLVVQFVTLLIHRGNTWMHSLSRTPFVPGSKSNLSWSFHDEDLPPEPTLEDLYQYERRWSGESFEGKINQQFAMSQEQIAYQ